MTTTGPVTVIGAGLGGIALVANLGLAGCRLRLLGRDFRVKGRNLEHLGLTGKTVSDIRAIVEGG